MAGVDHFWGFAASYSNATNSFAAGTTTFKAAAGNALSTGQAVKFDANGLVVPCDDATPEEVLGVIAGIFYFDDNLNRGVVRNTDKVAANVVTNVEGAGEYLYEGIKFSNGDGVGVLVITDPSIVFSVKATEAIPASGVGKKVQVAGNTTGNPRVTLTGADDTNSIAKIVGVLRVNGIPEYGPGATENYNEWGSPETIVLVQFLDTVFN